MIELLHNRNFGLELSVFLLEQGILQFGEEPFERGNLDAGRLSWLFGREVVPAEDPFDPADYAALLKIDKARAQASFPEAVNDD